MQDPTENVYRAAAQRTGAVSNFAPLQNAVAQLNESAKAYQRPRERRIAAEANRPRRILFKTERSLTRSEGLPRRDWFRHQIYAPGFYTGYGVKTLPGVREAIEQRNWKEAQTEIAIVSATIDRFAAEIKRGAGKMYK